MQSRVSCGVLLVCVSGLASMASAQAWDPIAFGPLGGLPNNAYWTSVADISGDGRTFLGGTSIGQVLLRTPTGDFNLSTTNNTSPFGLSRDGRVVCGGSTTIPVTWNIANANAGSIPYTNIPVPGGNNSIGTAYGTNADGTSFGLPNPTSVLTPSAYLRATPAFQAMNPPGTAGAYRGLASNAPILAILASFPGNPTNAYRWNYQAGTVSPLNMPAGASSIEAGAVGASISADGSRLGGTATIGAASKPYWWDADGTPHAVPMLPGAVIGNLSALNYTGTLGGGSEFISGQGNRAILYSLDGGQIYNLNDVYSQAGLLPAGWTLIATRHISDDGSRIFCQATAPDGSTRYVELTGNYVPTPGVSAVLALAGLLTTRRRR